jgi:hypothetical protein
VVHQYFLLLLPLVAEVVLNILVILLQLAVVADQAAVAELLKVQ